MIFGNLERSEWKRLPNIGGQIAARRYHTAVIQNKIMYVYGGVNKEGLYLKDLWCFYLSKKSEIKSYLFITRKPYMGQIAYPK